MPGLDPANALSAIQVPLKTFPLLFFGRVLISDNKVSQFTFQSKKLKNLLPCYTARALGAHTSYREVFIC